MAQKERYVCKKISKDCLFPEILCELKDTESKFFVVLESKDDAIKIADLLNHQDKCIKELENQFSATEEMRIDEFEFQDKNGNEIEPTKNQLVIYIKSLHKQIKNFKELSEENRKLTEELDKYKGIVKQVTIDELERFKNYIFTKIYLTANGDEEKINTYIDLRIKELKGE